MLDEFWQDVWGDSRTNRQTEPTANISLVLRYNLADSVNLHQYVLRLTDYLHAGKGRGDRLICALEDADVNLLFKLHNHSTQRWLGDITRVSRFRKTTKAVDCNYISKLLKVHSCKLGDGWWVLGGCV